MDSQSPVQRSCMKTFALNLCSDSLLFIQDGRVLFFNTAFERLLSSSGASPQELDGILINRLPFFSDYDNERFSIHVSKSLMLRVTSTLTMTFAHSPDLTFEVSLSPADDNSVACIFKPSHFKISSHRYSELFGNSFEGSYDWMSIIVEQFPVSMCIGSLGKDDSITFLYGNNLFCDNVEMVTGTSSLNTLPECASLIRENFDISRKTSGPSLYFTGKGDKLLFHLITSIPGRETNDRRFIIGTRRATKPEIEQQEIIRKSDLINDLVDARTRELREAVQAKTRFLTIMSHEIRTPLSGIIGMMSLLSEGPIALPAEAQDMIRTAQLCGDQLMVVINDILEYSRMEEGAIRIEEAPFSLHTILEESVEVVSFEAEKKKLELIFDCDPKTQDLIIGDTKRFRQILVNLLSNAIKFSDKGEIVLAATSRTVERNDCFDWCELVISCEDAGIGISEDDLSSIFNSFNQVDGSTTRKYGGSGLGLSISKKLAELMGGTLSCKSSIGEGSTFYFSVAVRKFDPQNIKMKDFPQTLGIPIPCAPPHHASNSDQDSNDGVDNKFVAVIESSDTFRRVLTSRLSSLHFSVVSFSNVPDFRQYLKSIISGIPFHSILLDSKLYNSHALDLPKFTPMFVVTGFKRPTDLRHDAKFIKRPIRAAALFDLFFRRNPPRSSSFSSTNDSSSPLLSSSSSSSSSFSHLKVLVAEDNVTNQKVIKLLLGRLGIKDITIVSDGLKALDSTKQSTYDVIFMDLMMPEMNGLESTERIRKEIPIYQQPYIIALTANGFDEDRRTCLNVGMNAVLTKPINKAELSDALSMHSSHLLSKVPIRMLEEH